MRSILMNNISVVAGLCFLLGVLGQLVSAAPPLPNVRSVSEHKWQELEEVNVDEVVESIMLHWRKSVCKRLSIIRR